MWTFDNIFIEARGKSHSRILTLKNIRLRDAGIYICSSRDSKSQLFVGIGRLHVFSESNRVVSSC